MSRRGKMKRRIKKPNNIVPKIRTRKHKKTSTDETTFIPITAISKTELFGKMALKLNGNVKTVKKQMMPYLNHLENEAKGITTLRDEEPPWYMCGSCTSTPRVGVCIFGACCNGSVNYNIMTGQVNGWSIKCAVDVPQIPF